MGEFQLAGLFRALLKHLFHDWAQPFLSLNFVFLLVCHGDQSTRRGLRLNQSTTAMQQNKRCSRVWQVVMRQPKEGMRSN